MSRRKFPAPPSLSRKAAFREPKIKILIFSEGANTEPTYIKQFARLHGNGQVKIKIHGGAGAPKTILEEARDAIRAVSTSKNSYDRYDQVWAIFDRDDHEEIARCRSEARDCGVRVAYSNPCFEVWILLHYIDLDSPDDRWALYKRLKALDKSYDPNGSKTVCFDSLGKEYGEVKAKAERLRRRRIEEGDEFGRPYTDVDILLDVIMENGRS